MVSVYVARRIPESKAVNMNGSLAHLGPVPAHTRVAARQVCSWSSLCWLLGLFSSSAL